MPLKSKARNDKMLENEILNFEDPVEKISKEMARNPDNKAFLEDLLAQELKKPK